MSKDLEALEKLKKDHFVDGRLPLIDKARFKLIEKELQEKAKFDAFMKRYNIDSVEELDTFFNEHLNNDIDKCSKCKELKALDILRKSKPIETVLKNGNAIVFIQINFTIETQEEYDILKEVLL